LRVLSLSSPLSRPQALVSARAGRGFEQFAG